MRDLLIAVSLIYVALSVAASVFVIRRDDLSRHTKGAQCVAIWLVPILGAWFFYKANRLHDEPQYVSREQEGGVAGSGNEGGSPPYGWSDGGADGGD